MDNGVDYKAKYEAILKKWDSLELQGKAKLYYSLNRNMSDLSDMLDGIDFKKVNVDDPKDKTKERVRGQELSKIKY